MDPITQGVLGVSAAQLVATRREKVVAAAIGFLAGMSADLDVLIRSQSDPLLALEYHRHFTHSLIFIPVGALICSLVFRLFSKRVRQRLSFPKIYLFCFTGYATHAVLDACTTYGTQLFWPFSSERIAWNNVSVIDPLFTLPLLILVLIAIGKRSTPIALVSAAYAFAYLGFGVVQNERAEMVARELAEQRGHVPINLGVKPSFANLIAWKSVYEFEGRYFVDAVRVAGSTSVIEGTTTNKLDVSNHFPWLNPLSQQALDIKRFAWFSAEHLALDPNNNLRIIDMRYSMLPNGVEGMWGIVLDPEADMDQHVAWTTTRPQGQEAWNNVRELWEMIIR